MTRGLDRQAPHSGALAFFGHSFVFCVSFALVLPCRPGIGKEKKREMDQYEENNQECTRFMC